MQKKHDIGSAGASFAQPLRLRLHGSWTQALGPGPGPWGPGPALCGRVYPCIGNVRTYFLVFVHFRTVFVHAHVQIDDVQVQVDDVQVQVDDVHVQVKQWRRAR